MALDNEPTITSTDTPVVTDRQIVVTDVTYDGWVLMAFHLERADIDSPIPVTMRFRRARVMPNGKKEIMPGDPSQVDVVVNVPDIAILAKQYPAAIKTPLLSLIQMCETIARQSNKL